MLARGPKCRVAADTARTVPRELRRRLWSGNLVNLLRKRREEEHKWLARAKGKPLSLIIPPFFPLFLFSHYTLSPRVHRNANVFISSTANQCTLRAHQLVYIYYIYTLWTLTSFAFETCTRAANTTAKLSRNFSDTAVMNGSSIRAAHVYTYIHIYMIICAREISKYMPEPKITVKCQVYHNS